MFQHLLVPLDGTAHAESILPHLRRLARAGTRAITLLRVDLPVSVEAFTLLCEAAQKRAREYLAGVRDRLGDLGIHCQILSRIGSPAQTILEVAREREASAILLSTHRRKGIARWLLGSISEQVLERSSVPVIAVPPGWTYELAPLEPLGLRPIRKILVPMGPDPSCLRVLPRAIELAQKFGSSIHLLHVRDGEASGKGDSDDAMEQRMKEAWLQCASSGVEAHRRLESGLVVPCILEVAREGEMDWIAMATEVRSGLARWMAGSLAERVLREAGVPMLVVRSASELRGRPIRTLEHSRRT